MTIRDIAVKVARISYDYLGDNEALSDEMFDDVYDLVPEYGGGEPTEAEMIKAMDIEAEVWKKAYAILGQQLINMSLVWDRLKPFDNPADLKCDRDDCDDRASFTFWDNSQYGGARRYVCGIYHAVPPFDKVEVRI